MAKAPSLASRAASSNRTFRVKPFLPGQRSPIRYVTPWLPVVAVEMGASGKDRTATPSPWLPGVVVSADASPGQLERLLAAGANGFLAKPIDLAEFMTALDSHLAQVVAS